MALEEWERTTDTSTEQFAEFIAFLVKNDLLDDALTELNSKGLNKIRVSVQHIRVMQEFIKNRYAAADKRPAGADVIPLSAHVDGYCHPH